MLATILALSKQDSLSLARCSLDKEGVPANNVELVKLFDRPAKHWISVDFFLCTESFRLQSSNGSRESNMLRTEFSGQVVVSLEVEARSNTTSNLLQALIS